MNNITIINTLVQYVNSKNGDIITDLLTQAVDEFINSKKIIKEYNINIKELIKKTIALSKRDNRFNYDGYIPYKDKYVFTNNNLLLVLDESHGYQCTSSHSMTKAITHILDALETSEKIKLDVEKLKMSYALKKTDFYKNKYEWEKIETSNAAVYLNHKTLLQLLTIFNTDTIYVNKNPYSPIIIKDNIGQYALTTPFSYIRCKAIEEKHKIIGGNDQWNT